MSNVNQRTMAVAGLALCAACMLDASASEAATPDPGTTTLWYKQPAGPRSSDAWDTAVAIPDGAGHGSSTSTQGSSMATLRTITF